jgi:Family of unknown function (DUF6526)
MSDQSYSNHSQLVTGYHKIGFTVLLILLVGSVRFVWISVGTTNLDAALLILGLTIMMVLVGFYARVFALRAQDRAIRAEENLRHFVQHGSLLPSNLTMRQIIGLRFASDEEFSSLASKAAETGMDEKEIKQSIQNWKADNDRV